MSDLFDEAYDRQEVAYGQRPSSPVAEYLRQVGGSGPAFDVAAGAGRDTLALAQAGYRVTAIDLSSRGLERIVERARASGVENNITTRVADAREIEWPVAGLSAVVATTLLDHLPAEDAEPLFARMCDALDDNGFLYAEVHTTADPGSPSEPGRSNAAPVSETATAVVNYFAPNQLIGWALRDSSRLRVLKYEERLEWDRTHGAPHLHGKAILLAVREGHHPDWYGQPPEFPRPPFDSRHS